MEDVGIVIEKKAKSLSDLASSFVEVIRNGGPGLHGWTEVDIRLSMDSYSTVEMTATWDPSRKELRDTFRPFSFYPMRVTVAGDDLFNGTIVGIDPEADADKSLVKVSAYALPGKFADVNAPAKNVPFEWRNMGLRAIAEAITKPFGIPVEFGGGAVEGAKFKNPVRLGPDQKINDLLAELARLRGLVLTNTPKGALLFLKPTPTGNPVAHFEEGVQPLGEYRATHNPQDYFSEVTAFQGARRGRKGGVFTEKNPWLQTNLRPLNFSLDKVEKGDAPAATRAALGRMFANMASYEIPDLPTWRDPIGRLWQPNTTVTVGPAPRIMIYKPTELVIRAVNFHQDAEKETASLELVLPGAFSGEVPKRLPWDE